MATNRISVHIYADDPISRAGVSSQLRPRPEVLILSDEECHLAKVAVVVADRVTEHTLQVLRSLSRSGTARLVLVAGQLDDADLVAAVQVGIAGLVRRCDATVDRLISVIQSAALGEGTVPPDLLGRLLDQVGRLQRKVLDPRGLTLSTLTVREADMLRLVAEGLDTAEIAVKTSYSERTVKNVLHDVITRFNLRNRAHAVGFVMQHGLI